MNAFKTVAVALGITLAAVILIPLIILAGLFVWLEGHRRGRRRDPRAGPGRRLIDPSRSGGANAPAEPISERPPMPSAGVVAS